MQPFAIAPSILSANFARLGEEVDNVLAAGADIVHFDVMDNHYVPNLTIGPMVCSALRKHGVTAPIDVHLMVKPVDRMIGDFLEAGATYITFHPEASEHIDRSLQLIKDGGAKAGLVFNPATPLEVLKDRHSLPTTTQRNPLTARTRQRIRASTPQKPSHHARSCQAGVRFSRKALRPS